MQSGRSRLQYLESGAGKNQLVVIFHGYGANAFDLFPLSGELKFKAHYVFPQGPLQVPIGPGFMGQAWFPVDVEAHEKSQRLGAPLDYSKKSYRVMEGVLQKSADFIANVNAGSAPVIVGGFSQGSMLATELALTLPEPPKALIILSGTLLDEDHLTAALAQRHDFAFFQSHGRSDAVLPFGGAERLRDVLQDSGVEGEFVEFNGGHDIPALVLQKLDRFLMRISGNA